MIRWRVLRHPSAGKSAQDISKIAIRWVEGVTERRRKALLKVQGLSLMQTEVLVHSRRRPLVEVNNSLVLSWAESMNPISQAVLEALEESPLIRWIAPVYRGESEFEGPERMFCVNPTVLYIRPNSAKVLGEKVEEFSKIDPSINIDRHRTELLHGLTVLNLEGTSLVENRGAQHLIEILRRRLRAVPGTSPRDLVFETIPLIRPTAQVLDCNPPATGLVPDDPLFLNKDWGLSKIKAPYAWRLTQGDPSILVAVIDQGVEPKHPDLDVHPLSWNATEHRPGGNPVGRHGTPCAGIIAARINNGEGVCGVAGKCRIMAIATSTWADTDIVEGLYFAVDNGARVVSMSFGDHDLEIVWDTSVIKEALQYAFDNGVVLVAAAGNENISRSNFPAKDPRAICVGGCTQQDERKRKGDTSGEDYWGSNYGKDLDVVAPCIMISTTDGLAGAGYSTFSDYYYYFNGTSAATAHVAGLAALILSLRPGLDNRDVRKIIEMTCDKIGTHRYKTYRSRPHGSWNRHVGYGRINAERAILFACSYRSGS